MDQATRKLYYKDAYTKDFESRVLDVIPVKYNLYDVILEQTAFYPEGGGQVADRGILADGQVVDVHIKNDVILHRTAFNTTPDITDTVVSGSIDWDFRFTNMQQHTGEHMFSGLVRKHFGYENVGFHLSENTVTMDYDGKLSDDDIQMLELLTNEAIYQGIPVKTYYPDSHELEALDFRAKLDIATMGKVRIVTIPDIDDCACCAPHVKNTAEIGILKVISHGNYKGGTRIHILCGKRALLDFRYKHESLLALSHLFSVPMEEVLESIQKQTQELEKITEKLSALEAAIIDSQCQGLTGDNPVLFTEIGDKILLRKKANELVASHTGVTYVFNGNDDQGYNFIIASKDSDAKKALDGLKEKLDLKGGGSGEMVQGSTQAKRADIESILGVI